METTKVEPKRITPQEFVDKYTKLCEETGFNIVVSPAFIKRDDGTFSLVLQNSIGEMSKK